MHSIIGYRSEAVYGDGYRNIDEVIDHEINELDNDDIIDTLKNKGLIRNKSGLSAYITKLKGAGYTEVLWLANTKQDIVDIYRTDIDTIDFYSIIDGILISDIGIDGKLIAYNPLKQRR